MIFKVWLIKTDFAVSLVKRRNNRRVDFEILSFISSDNQSGVVFNFKIDELIIFFVFHLFFIFLILNVPIDLALIKLDCLVFIQVVGWTVLILWVNLVGHVLNRIIQIWLHQFSLVRAFPFFFRFDHCSIRFKFEEYLTWKSGLRFLLPEVYCSFKDSFVSTSIAFHLIK